MSYYKQQDEDNNRYSKSVSERDFRPVASRLLRDVSDRSTFWWKEDPIYTAIISDIPENERSIYQHIPVCIRRAVRASTIFCDAKCLIESWILSNNKGIRISLESMVEHLIEIDLLEINCSRTDQHKRRYFAYNDNLDHNVTTEAELKTLEPSEVDSFLQDRLIIEICLVKKDGRASMVLYLDKPL